MVENILSDPTVEHHGIKGMHWGVRKDAPSGPTGVTVSIKGKRLVTKGGSGHSPSSDAVKAAAAAQKARKSGTHSLDNTELQALVSRMNLQQQYSNLHAKQTKEGPISQGYKFVKVLLGVGKTANEVHSFVNSPVGKQLRERLGH